MKIENVTRYWKQFSCRFVALGHKTIVHHMHSTLVFESSPFPKHSVEILVLNTRQSCDILPLLPLIHKLHTFWGLLTDLGKWSICRQFYIITYIQITRINLLSVLVYKRMLEANKICRHLLKMCVKSNGIEYLARTCWEIT